MGKERFRAESFVWKWGKDSLVCYSLIDGLKKENDAVHCTLKIIVSNMLMTLAPTTIETLSPYPSNHFLYVSKSKPFFKFISYHQRWKLLNHTTEHKNLLISPLIKLFQNIFYLEIYLNNIFYFLKIYL
jgi:hypothetical protein